MRLGKRRTLRRAWTQLGNDGIGKIMKSRLWSCHGQMYLKWRDSNGHFGNELNQQGNGNSPKRNFGLEV